MAVPFLASQATDPARPSLTTTLEVRAALSAAAAAARRPPPPPVQTPRAALLRARVAPRVPRSRMLRRATPVRARPPRSLA